MKLWVAPLSTIAESVVLPTYAGKTTSGSFPDEPVDAMPDCKLLCYAVVPCFSFLVRGGAQVQVVQMPMLLLPAMVAAVVARAGTPPPAGLQILGSCLPSYIYLDRMHNFDLVVGSNLCPVIQGHGPSIDWPSNLARCDHACHI